MALEFEGPRMMRSDELRASERLSALCFEDIIDTDGEETELPPQFHQAETYLIASAGKPVSQISIFHTPLKMYDGVVKVGSIGGVCTHPDFRGHGLATQLMEHCTRQLVQGGASLMLISGGRGLYTRLGNVPFGKYAGFQLQANQLPPAAPGIQLRPVTPTDISLGSRIYQSEPVHFVRQFSTYKDYFQSHEIGYQAEAWIVELEGEPTAYLMLYVPWEHFSQPGAGIRGLFEYAGSRVALAGALSAALKKAEIREIQALVPWQDVDFIHLIKARGAVSEWKALEDHTVRIINFTALMSGLRPYVQARLSPALRRGLRFKQSGPLLAGSGEGCCTIRRGRDCLELDTAAMTSLVLGDAEDRLGSGFSAPGALAEVVQSLFPLPAFLPGLDYH
jgi:GNAT superfamily N-acetyltransferase